MYKIIAHIRKKHGRPTDNNDIEAVANELLGELIGNEDSENNFPLPVVQLMVKLGFDVFRTDFKNSEQSGLIVVDNALPEINPVFKKNKAILLNRRDSIAHQRFTVAHELAHYIFDFNEQSDPIFYKAYYTTEDKTHQEEEVRAGRFAAALLMPAGLFTKRFLELKAAQGESFSMNEAIAKLKEYFGAPATAVNKRIEELQLLS